MSLRDLARVCGYGNNPARLSALNAAKSSAETMQELVDNLGETAKRKTRCDKLSGDPIWMRAWHEFTEVKKGQSFRSKMVCHERVKDEATKKMVWKSTWLRHPKRYMVYKIAEVHDKVLKWPPYLEWREKYLERNPKIPKTWHVGWKRLYKERCFCVDEKEQVRKCGCEYHLKMEELVAGLHRWRQIQNKKLSTKVPKKSCAACVDGDKYLACTKNLSSFGDDACPCPRGRDGLRKLECVTGACSTCRNLRLVWSQCTCLDDEELPPVKYKWLRPIQIGGRADTEWAWMELPYAEFENLLVSYYEDTYRLHNWVYKRQVHACMCMNT